MTVARYCTTMRTRFDEMASRTKARQSVFRRFPPFPSPHPCDDAADPAGGRRNSEATPGEDPATCAKAPRSSLRRRYGKSAENLLALRHEREYSVRL